VGNTKATARVLRFWMIVCESSKKPPSSKEFKGILVLDLDIKIRTQAEGIEELEALSR
jgi:hypothetical protein